MRCLRPIAAAAVPAAFLPFSAASTRLFAFACWRSPFAFMLTHACRHAEPLVAATAPGAAAAASPSRRSRCRCRRCFAVPAPPGRFATTRQTLMPLFLAISQSFAVLNGVCQRLRHALPFFFCQRSGSESVLLLSFSFFCLPPVYFSPLYAARMLACIVAGARCCYCLPPARAAARRR